MNKITRFFPTSQVEYSKKRKKGQILRNPAQGNAYLELLGCSKPESISHNQGFSLRSLLSRFTPRNKKATNVIFREIIKASKKTSRLPRQYFVKAAGYESEKTISRLVKKLENAGILTVDQYVKETNTYSLGALLKDKIVVSYLVAYIPALRWIMPALFSVSLLLSQKVHPMDHVPHHNRNIYIKSYKNNIEKRKVKKEVEMFEKDFLYGDYVPQKTIQPPQEVDSKNISCCTFRRMTPTQRITYFRKYLIGHQDSGKGYIPISPTLQNMLLCEKSGCMQVKK